LRERVVFLGVILIALGVIIYLILPVVTSTQSIASQDAITVLAGSSVPRAIHLPSGADVDGTVNQVIGQVTNDIDFYVFDRTNYQSWFNKQTSVWYIKIFRATSGSPFSFRTDKEDDYYFVFDNPGVFLNGERQITWSASYRYAPYAAYAILLVSILSVIGAVVIVSGLDIVGKWRSAKTRKCPQCGQTVKLDKTVCPHCGFDITKSVRCKHCNAIYDSSLHKCPNCGAKQE
jgi:predicted RNA-binding Zn-ribbon protein involved in translation (DUF1610 family)